jgi:hypothetical protein
VVEIIEHIYAGIDGYTLSEHERTMVNEESGEKTATYGEITPQAVDALIKIFNLGPDDVFYDLGSGVGKAVIQVGLTAAVKKAVGVELSSTRHERALTALKQLEDLQSSGRIENITFIHGNFLSQDLHDATHILLCSTCFPDELMEKLSIKLAELKPGVKIATLRLLPPHPKFAKISTHMLPMSWIELSEVHIYEVIPNPNEKVDWV